MSDSKTPNCINCGSDQARYDSAFGIYKCETCSTVWGKDKDDPDYDEPASCPKCGHFLEESVDEMQVFLDCPICDYAT
jgi:DNA-directed RNA polymerase subunit RPC12/RpoP